MNPFKVKAALGYSTGSRLYPLVKQLLTLKVNSQNCPPVIPDFTGANNAAELADELSSIVNSPGGIPAIVNAGDPLPWQIGQGGSGINPYFQGITNLLIVAVNIFGPSTKNVRVIDSNGNNWYVPIGGSSGAINAEFLAIDLTGAWSVTLNDGDPPLTVLTCSITAVAATITGIVLYGGGATTNPSNPVFTAGNNFPQSTGQSGTFNSFVGFGSRIEVTTGNGGGTITVTDSLGNIQTQSNLVADTYGFDNVRLIAGIPWSILID